MRNPAGPRKIKPTRFPVKLLKKGQKETEQSIQNINLSTMSLVKEGQAKTVQGNADIAPFWKL